MEQPQEASQEQAQAALRQATQAGLEAESLLHNPLLVQWYQDTNNGLISRLGEVTLGDKEARCRIVDLMWLLQQFSQHSPLPFRCFSKVRCRFLFPQSGTRQH